MQFAPRDFVETEKGLFFAVVAGSLEEGRVLSFLRYRHDGEQFHKFDTASAWQFLRKVRPEFVYRSKTRDVETHGVPLDHVRRQWIPQSRAATLLNSEPTDCVGRTAARVLRRLIAGGVASETLGVTGSLLIGAHGPNSDINLVVADREQFRRARQVVREFLEERECEPLTEAFWREAFARRGGSLSLNEYVWHERRKFNKLSVDQTKIDLCFVSRSPAPPSESFRKLERVEIRAVVQDDSAAFDSPAVWHVDSNVASQVVSWTHTFTGQAVAGETILVRGWLEESRSGWRQVVVGSSREAEGDVIAVLQS